MNIRNNEYKVDCWRPWLFFQLVDREILRSGYRHLVVEIGSWSLTLVTREMVAEATMVEVGEFKH